MNAWGPGAQGGFQNALAMGLQFGQMARQAQDRRDERNALAAFVSNPSRETAAAVAPFNPQLAYQYGQDQRAAQVKQQQKQQGDGQTYVRLLEAAKDNPQQAFAAAQQMGLDLSGVPQVGTPEFESWRRNSLFVMKALSDPEKLTSVQQDAQALGLDLNTPEGLKAVQELTLYKYAKNGVDEYGRPTLELPQIGMPGQQQAQPKPAAPMPRPEGMTDDQLFEMGRKAVESGAPIEEVFQRLKAWGVKVT